MVTEERRQTDFLVEDTSINPFPAETSRHKGVTYDRHH